MSPATRNSPMSPNNRQPIFSAGHDDAQRIASILLLTCRAKLTATDLQFARHVAAGRPIDEPRALVRLQAIRDRAQRRPEPRQTYGFHRRAA